MLLELGLIPLHVYGIRDLVKNWERLRGQKTNDLPSASYRDAENVRLPWLSNIKTFLEENGMSSLFTNPNLVKPLFINRKLFQILSDAFHQKSFEDIALYFFI